MTKCEELIITDNTLRGTGNEFDPYRRVVEVYSKDGRLLATHDPLLGNLLRTFAERVAEERQRQFILGVAQYYPEK